MRQVLDGLALGVIVLGMLGAIGAWWFATEAGYTTGIVLAVTAAVAFQAAVGAAVLKGLSAVLGRLG